MNNVNESQRQQGSSSYLERRRKSDWVINMATLFSIVSWAVSFAVWVVLDMAAPEKTYMFTRKFTEEIRDYWDSSLLPIALTLLIASLCVCVIAFCFNMMRMRRKSDKYRKSIIIIGVVNIIGIVSFLIRFSDVLFN